MLKFIDREVVLRAVESRMKIALCIVTVHEVVLAFLEFITGKVLMGDRLLGLYDVRFSTT